MAAQTRKQKSRRTGGRERDADMFISVTDSLLNTVNEVVRHLEQQKCRDFSGIPFLYQRRIRAVGSIYHPALDSFCAPDICGGAMRSTYLLCI